MAKLPDYIGNERRAAEVSRMEAVANLTAAVQELAKSSAQQEKTMQQISTDLTAFKIGIKDDLNLIQMDVQKALITYQSFMDGYEKRIVTCDKMHDDHELRLRQAATLPECKHEKDIETLKKENKEQDNKIYKILGAGAILLPVSTAVLIGIGQWIFKKLPAILP